jgi:hypothetical protein
MSRDQHHFTRRSVLRTAAWTAPAITVLAAAPAFAASGTAPVWSLAWSSDSFLADGTVNNTIPGTPEQAGTYALFRIDVNVASGSLTALSAALASTASGTGNNKSNGVSIYASNNSASRGGTTWAAQAADIANYGWAPSPTVTTTKGSTTGPHQTWSFARGAAVTAAGTRLQLVLSDFDTNDLPVVIVFSNVFNNVTTTKTVTITETSGSPYLTGTVR